MGRRTYEIYAQAWPGRDGEYAAPVDRRCRVARWREGQRDRLVGSRVVGVRQSARRDRPTGQVDTAVRSEIDGEVRDLPVAVVSGAEVFELDDDRLRRSGRIQVGELSSERDAVALAVGRVVGIQVAVDVGVRRVGRGVWRNDLGRALVQRDGRRGRRAHA